MGGVEGGKAVARKYSVKEEQTNKKKIKKEAKQKVKIPKDKIYIIM